MRVGLLRNKIFKNASWIIVCKIIQSILSLVIGVLSARYLGPSNYGVINYAVSLTAFFLPLMKLGINSVLVQEVINAKNGNDGEIMGTSLVLCAINSVFCVFAIVCVAFLLNFGERETIIVCSLYSLSLIFSALEMIQYWFQAKLKSKYTSIVMLVAYIITAIYKVFLLVTKKNIFWFALSYSIDYFIIAISLIVIYLCISGNKLSFSWNVAKRLVSKGKYYIVSSMMVTIFAQTDKIMLKLMVGNEATGYYTAACVCASVTSFIFSAIIDSFRPVVLESKNIDQSVFEKNVVKFYSIIIYFSLAQCVGITLFSELIVNILYGADYVESINVLRIVVWYTTFSYLGSVRNVWILAENQQKYLWIINLSGAMMNVILNFVLITLLGIMGAAIASLFTQFFTNVIMGYFIKPIRKNNTLMLKGLNPRNIIEMIKK